MNNSNFSDDDNDNNDEEIYNDLVNKQNEIIENITYYVNVEFQEYCQTNALPLCENLNLQNISNFVNFILL
jgi:uncharacterized sporulation protein YeaH/YhbH (DUF444 family)